LLPPAPNERDQKDWHEVAGRCVGSDEDFVQPEIDRRKDRRLPPDIVGRYIVEKDIHEIGLQCVGV
jgi:hypothetical protein